MSALKALVVDDSATARLLLVRLLKPMGCESVQVESGEAALETLRHDRPDVIFLDHLMPGMDGFETLQAIKGDHHVADIPVYMYTSQAASKYADEAITRGAAGVLSKQIDKRKLYSIIESIGGGEAAATVISLPPVAANDHHDDHPQPEAPVAEADTHDTQAEPPKPRSSHPLLWAAYALALFIPSLLALLLYQQAVLQEEKVTRLAQQVEDFQRQAADIQTRQAERLSETQAQLEEDRALLAEALNVLTLQLDSLAQTEPAPTEEAEPEAETDALTAN